VAYDPRAVEILTAQQMKKVDAVAIRRAGIPAIVLMENAGLAVADAATAMRPAGPAPLRAAIVCGPGNNGGDGLVAARILHGHGARVRCVLAARAGSLRGEAMANLDAARAAGVEVTEAATPAAWGRVARHGLFDCDLLVDALLGTGLSRPARGLFARIIADCNGSGVPILAVDIPSGLSGDTETIPGPAIRASATIALCRPKRPHLLPPGDAYVGRLSIASIGIPDAAVASVHPDLHAQGAAELAGAIPQRRRAAHKGDFGHVLVVAGSRDKSGAAALAAQASLRAGCGLVTAAVPASVQGRIARSLPEMMTSPLPETRAGALGEGALAPALAMAAERDVVALGPGLGTDLETVAFVRAFVRKVRRPLVLDADGCNAFAGAAVRLLSGRGRTLVLTPHPGEMSRLLGTTTAALARDRVGAARRFAKRHACTLVLKGHRTLVALRDGTVWVNTSGDPVLATAGSGDMLTGFLAGLLAQGIDPPLACRAAVWLHGRAGELAAARHAPGGILASELGLFWGEAARELTPAAGARR